MLLSLGKLVDGAPVVFNFSRSLESGRDHSNTTGTGAFVWGAAANLKAIIGDVGAKASRRS